jgi:putative DNA primase/helicase
MMCYPSPEGRAQAGADGRPEALPVLTDHIPDVLRRLARWLVWKYVEDVDPETGEVDWDKPPMNAKGGPGSSTNPKTWSPFEKALAAYLSLNLDGMGFVLDGTGDLVAIDLDKCRDPVTGEIEPWALEIVRKVDSYTEVSPSGRGLRIFARGKLPPGRRRKDHFEIYNTARYVTVTGQRVEGTPPTVEDRGEAIAAVHRQVFGEPKPKAECRGPAPSSRLDLDDRELIRRACEAQISGPKFRRLWQGDLGGHGSHSEADLALCNYLAFWAQGDPEWIDALFRQSGLFRSKWQRDDYRERTIAKALDGRTEFYDPTRYRANGSHGGSAKKQKRKPRPRGEPPGLSNADEDGRALSAVSIAEGLFRRVGGFPKRVGERLFVEGSDDRPLYLDSDAAVFAWAGRHLAGEGRTENPIVWGKADGLVTRAEFVATLRQTAEDYDAVEALPHHPPMPRTFYMHPEPKGGDGKALRELLRRFRPATGVDEDLLHAFFCTLLWGGEPGQRPAFLFEGDEGDEAGGRGVGKTSVARMAGLLVGGLLSVRTGEDFDKLMTRLLSPAGLSCRVALIDNLKSLRFSWGDLEGLITADIISGRSLYIGEGRRPNTLTWVITANGASLSRDMAQRCVPVRLARPPQDPTWEAETLRLIRERRWEIVGDVLAELRREVEPLRKYTRWSSWESEVLAHVAEPADAQKVIEERQGSIDDDRAEADLVRDRFVEEVKNHFGDPGSAVVWIPSAVAACLVNEATGEPRPKNKANTFLGTLGIRELRKSNQGKGRGWTWRGQQARPDQPAQDMPGRPGPATDWVT